MLNNDSVESNPSAAASKLSVTSATDYLTCRPTYKNPHESSTACRFLWVTLAVLCVTLLFCWGRSLYKTASNWGYRKTLSLNPCHSYWTLSITGATLEHLVAGCTALADEEGHVLHNGNCRDLNLQQGPRV